MNFILGLTIGLIIGGIVVWFLMKNKKQAAKEPVAKELKFENPAVEVKKENLIKLEQFIAEKSATDKITNDDIQALLSVSDATAERYLQTLEKQGKLKQHGIIGKEVYYQKI